MVIENENKYVLTNNKTVRKTGKTIDSDHKTEYLDLDLKIKHEQAGAELGQAQHKLGWDCN